MAKKKMFGVSSNLTKGLTETVNAVTNNLGQCRYEVISLARIELDPHNPRELLLTLNDIREGIAPNDKDHEKKSSEYERLVPLANTIKEQGIINPIAVYKHADNYRIIAGERRFLASHIAQRTDIQAKVYNEKPEDLNLRLLQWIENNEREDLSLKDRLNNIASIVNAYRSEHGVDPIPTRLSEIMSISLPQAANYLTVLNAPKNLQVLIEQGSLTNLEKVAFLTKIEEASIQAALLHACLNGATLKQLRIILEKEEHNSRSKSTLKKKQSIGRPASKIYLGYIQKPQVVATLFRCVLDYPSFRHHKSTFKNIDFNDPKQASTAFQKLIQTLDEEEAVS